MAVTPLLQPGLPNLAFAAARFGAMPDGGFAAGTALDTPGGPVPVERLRPGDWLTTINGGSVRLRYAALARALVGQAGGAQAGAVLLPPDALGLGRPRRALHLSARQAVWLAEADCPTATHHAVAAAGLLCGAAVRWADGGSPPLYLLLAEAGPVDGAGVVLAEGLACALCPPTRPEHDLHAGVALAAARLAQQRAQVRHEAASLCLDGAVRLDARHRLSGWAMNRAAPEVPVLLEILLDDLTVGFTLADELRPDLAMAGLGAGACGFALTLALPPGHQTSFGALLRLHAVGTGAALPGTPLLVMHAAEA